MMRPLFLPILLSLFHRETLPVFAQDVKFEGYCGKKISSAQNDCQHLCFGTDQECVDILGEEYKCVSASECSMKMQHRELDSVAGQGVCASNLKNGITGCGDAMALACEEDLDCVDEGESCYSCGSTLMEIHRMGAMSGMSGFEKDMCDISESILTDALKFVVRPILEDSNIALDSVNVLSVRHDSISTLDSVTVLDSQQTGTVLYVTVKISGLYRPTVEQNLGEIIINAFNSGKRNDFQAALGDDFFGGVIWVHLSSKNNESLPAPPSPMASITFSTSFEDYSKINDITPDQDGNDIPTLEVVIVVGVLAGFIVIVAGLCYCCVKKPKNARSPHLMNQQQEISLQDTQWKPETSERKLDLDPTVGKEYEGDDRYSNDNTSSAYENMPLLNYDSDPNDIIVDDYEETAEQTGVCCLLWLFEPWLVIREQEVTSKNQREDMVHFKKQLGFTPIFCCRRKDVGGYNENTEEEYPHGNPRCSWRKTIINLIIFIVNCYTLIIHTIITEPKPRGEKCEVIFVTNPIRTAEMETLLLIVYSILPFLIAKCIKFVMENSSFEVLRLWRNLMTNRNTKLKDDEGDENLYKRMKEDVRNGQVRSYIIALFVYIVFAGVAGFALFFNCRSSYRWYDACLFALVCVFLASGVFALVVPYNMVRMYTCFIHTRIAMFQIDVKRNLHTFDKSMEKEKIEARKIEASKQGREDLVSAIKSNNTKILETQLISRRKLDQFIKEHLLEAKLMFQRMKKVNKKLEGPIQTILRLLLGLGMLTLLYIFFYSLHFYDNIWPEMKEQLYTTEPSFSPIPSSEPSLVPTSQPSMMPTSQPSMMPSFQPSQSSAPSSQPSQSSAPSSQPSMIPSSRPSMIPSFHPSQPSAPSSQPYITSSWDWDSSYISSLPEHPCFMPRPEPEPEPGFSDSEGSISFNPKEENPETLAMAGDAAPGRASSETSLEPSWKLVISILVAMTNLDPVVKNGLLFFSSVLIILLFNIWYVNSLLMLFARQVDAWDKLNKFFDARMVAAQDDVNSYGSEFNKLGRFVKSSTSTFEWIFIVKGQYETAVGTVMAQVKKKLIITFGTIAVAFLFGSVPRTLGIGNSVTSGEYLETALNTASAAVENAAGNSRALLRGAEQYFHDE